MRIGGGQNRLKPHSHFTHSHKLPKIAISLALLLGSANVALAEESGGFIGLGIGGGDTKTEYSVSSNLEGTNQYVTKRIDTYSGSLSYGFVAGYKQFFTPYLGLRYYANLNVSHAFIKNIESYNGVVEYTKDKINEMATLINYSANVDFLGNFLVTEMVDFGGFIGLGIGGTSLVGKYINDWKNALKDNGHSVSTTAFDIALNVGLRTNIATHHGLEVAVRVPFMPVTMQNSYIPSEGNYNDSGSGTMKQTIKQTFSVLARYTFSF